MLILLSVDRWCRQRTCNRWIQHHALSKAPPLRVISWCTNYLAIINCRETVWYLRMRTGGYCESLRRSVVSAKNREPWDTATRSPGGTAVAFSIVVYQPLRNIQLPGDGFGTLE